MAVLVDSRPMDVSGFIRQIALAAPAASNKIISWSIDDFFYLSGDLAKR